MIVKATEQSKENFCTAVRNRELHAASICPANHDVDYRNGWYYFDNCKPQRRPDLTREAERIMAEGYYQVGYWREGNCYVLIENPDYESEYDDG